MKTRLQSKAERLLRIDNQRKAHHRALASLHAAPMWNDPEKLGLAMWRKLRRIEAVAHDATTAQCNGAAYNGQPFRPDYDVETGDEADVTTWSQFKDSICADVAKVFGGKLPEGFFINGDARGAALKLDPDKCTVPEGMVTDWGKNGLLAAVIDN